MKRCPQCGTTYTDETLRFCLADGGSLVPVEEEPTVASPRRDAFKVNFGDQTPGTQPSTFPPPKGSSSGVKILIGLVIAGILGVLAVGAVFVAFVGYEIYRADTAVSTPTPTPTPVFQPTPFAQTSPGTDAEKLAEELLKLQKALEEQERGVNSNRDPNSQDVLSDVSTATVNSPNDGFLALRSLPSSDLGARIARIPHGDKVFVVSCDDTYYTIGSRRGRWCLVEWQQKVGWVFDAWLRFP